MQLVSCQQANSHDHQGIAVLVWDSERLGYQTDSRLIKHYEYYYIGESTHSRVTEFIVQSLQNT